MQATAQPAIIDFNMLDQFLRALGSASCDFVQNLPTNTGLWHYTSLDGALGILAGGDLWMSHLRFSNDDNEFKYGHDLLDEVLGRMENEAEGLADRPERLERLREVRRRMECTRGQAVYICCFCEKRNLLSQWRGYADNGGGVSIEFSAARFGQLLEPNSRLGLMRLWQVFYPRFQQEQLIRNCFDAMYWPLGIGQPPIDYIVGALQFFLPTFKNSDFQEEQERRLIFSPYPGEQPGLGYRNRGGMLVPYIRLSQVLDRNGGGILPWLPIESVMVGPGRHKDANAESLRMLLKQHGYGDVPVAASSTSYRN